MRDAIEGGREALLSLELLMVSGRSWTTKVRHGKAEARAILAWPLEPPT